LGQAEKPRFRMQMRHPAKTRTTTMRDPRGAEASQEAHVAQLTMPSGNNPSAIACPGAA